MSAALTNENDKSVITICSHLEDLHDLNILVRSVHRYIEHPCDIKIVTAESSKLEEHDALELGVDIIDFSSALKDYGFEKSQWSSSNYYSISTMGPMMAPLLPEFSGYDRMVLMDSDLFVSSKDFAQSFSIPLRDFEVLGLSYHPNPRNARPLLYAAERIPLTIRQGMERLWSRNPLYSRNRAHGATSIWNLKRIRADLDWYTQRVQWYFSLAKDGKFTWVFEDFINLFMDISPTLPSTWIDEPSWSGYNQVRAVHFHGKTHLMDDFAKREQLV